MLADRQTRITPAQPISVRVSSTGGRTDAFFHSSLDASFQSECGWTVDISSIEPIAPAAIRMARAGSRKSRGPHGCSSELTTRALDPIGIRGRRARASGSRPAERRESALTGKENVTAPKNGTKFKNGDALRCARQSNEYAKRCRDEQWVPGPHRSRHLTLRLLGRSPLHEAEEGRRPARAQQHGAARVGRCRHQLRRPGRHPIGDQRGQLGGVHAVAGIVVGHAVAADGRCRVSGGDVSGRHQRDGDA
eukprot:scaffold2854_cov116-Isochrysis_galbana.AAC.2